MKLVKKLFIITLLSSLLAPATVASRKINCETTLLSDGNTETSNYEDTNSQNINPHSMDIIKAI